MSTSIMFVAASDAAHSVMLAAGATPPAGPQHVPDCPLLVGDLITFPAAPMLVHRVAYRLLRQAESATWMVGLEPAETPWPAAAAD
jgi:hypothetical protein